MLGLETDIFFLLCIALLLACIFEFINGFHDTANAVATVIYTKSLKPTEAVILSGVMNFLGVVTGGIGVGISIVNLLPVELLIDQNVYHGVAMVMAILLAAIIWNFGTWYFGIPSSSSHTLIGAILGVGIGYGLLPGNSLDMAAINYDKASKVFSGLLLAPVIGFSLAIILMFLIVKVAPAKYRKEINSEPKPDSTPPTWIRAILISTSTLVSYFHGRNDGQKGIGLVMLILIGVLPAIYGVSSREDFEEVKPQFEKVESILLKIDPLDLGKTEQNELKISLENIAFLKNLNIEKELPKKEVRNAILTIASASKDLLEDPNVGLNKEDTAMLTSLTVKEESGLRKLTDFAPSWVILAISLSLGFGTMIGWKRIVITVGEKIGKTHLTYAQGASAELVAATTIGLASGFGLPVSTTHTLSSGIAGAMVASKGLSNLQTKTVKNIALTWLLTLPVSMGLSASLFLIFRYFLDK